MVNRRTTSELIFDVINTILLTLVAVICLYPMLHVLFGSLSHPKELFLHRGILWRPQGWFTKAYGMVLNNPNIVIGYTNTLFYVVIGTLARTFMTMITAYALAQKGFMLRRPLMIMFVITMYIGGGLIPNYLLINKLGMLNTRAAIIVPSLIATWNMIIMRTAFLQTPASLEESARLDGAGDMTILFRIVAPSNLATIVVIMMYYAVGEWNSWFSAAIYLTRRRDLFPLQLFLRETLINYSASGTAIGQTQVSADMDGIAGLVDEVVRYATIIVSTAPILVVYPFVQKYFVKGAMMGSLKG